MVLQATTASLKASDNWQAVGSGRHTPRVAASSQSRGLFLKMKNVTRAWLKTSSPRINPSPPEQPKPPTGRSSEISPRGFRVHKSIGIGNNDHEGTTNPSAFHDRAGSSSDTGRPYPTDRGNAEKLSPSPLEAHEESDDEDDVGTALPPRLGNGRATRDILTDLDRRAGLVDGISTTHRVSGQLQSISGPATSIVTVSRDRFVSTESTDGHKFQDVPSWRSTSDSVSDLVETPYRRPYKRTISWNQRTHSEVDLLQESTSNVSSPCRPTSTQRSQSFNRTSAISAKQGNTRSIGTPARPTFLPRAYSDTYQNGVRKHHPPDDRPPPPHQNHQGSDVIQGVIQKEMVGLSQSIEVLLSLLDPLDVASTSSPPLSPQPAPSAIRIEGSAESSILPRGPIKEAPLATFNSQEELYAWCRRQLLAEQTTNEIRVSLTTLSTQLETLKQETRAQEQQSGEECKALRVELAACAALVHERDVRLEALRLENLQQKVVIESHKSSLVEKLENKSSPNAGSQLESEMA